MTGHRRWSVLASLSATQKPLERIAAFLTGSSPRECKRVEVGHQRPWDLSVEIPDDELGSLASHEMWGQVYDRLIALAGQHRTTLIFVNTRKLSERVAHDLGERLLLLHAEGDEVVPVEHSRELHAAAPGSRLVEAPGGHHRSIQHDPEFQALSVRFLARRLREAAEG